MVVKAFSYEFWKANRSQEGITIYDNDFAQIVGVGEAIYIRRMLFFWSKWGCKNKKGIFLRPEKFISSIGMTNYTFRKITERWEELGILTTKVVGRTRKKWFKINEEKLAEYLTHLFNLAHKNDEKSVLRKRKSRNAKTKNAIYSSRIKNLGECAIKTHIGALAKRQGRRCDFPEGFIKSRNTIKSKATLLLSPKEIKKQQRASKLGVMLQNIMIKNKWTINRRHPDNLIAPILKLKDNKAFPVKFSEIRAAIDFLKDNAGTKMCPVIHNVDQFAKKYPQILDMIQRTNGELKPAEKSKSDEPINLRKLYNRTLATDNQPCSTCHKRNHPVYHVLKPGVSGQLIYSCEHCYHKLERLAEKQAEIFRAEEDAELENENMY